MFINLDNSSTMYYFYRPKFRRTRIIGNPAVLKTADLAVLGVRVPRPPFFFVMYEAVILSDTASFFYTICCNRKSFENRACRNGAQGFAIRCGPIAQLRERVVNSPVRNSIFFASAFFEALWRYNPFTVDFIDCLGGGGVER